MNNGLLLIELSAYTAFDNLISIEQPFYGQLHWTEALEGPLQALYIVYIFECTMQICK